MEREDKKCIGGRDEGLGEGLNLGSITKDVTYNGKQNRIYI